MQVLPEGPGRTHIQQGFCFPEETTHLAEFPSVLDRYLARWHIAVSEDNAISLNQQRSVRSVYRVPGRLNQLEFGLHSFNNWLISKVIDGEGNSWFERRSSRIGAEGEGLWSNDDPRMRRMAEEVGKGAPPADEGDGGGGLD